MVRSCPGRGVKHCRGAEPKDSGGEFHEISMLQDRKPVLTSLTGALIMLCATSAPAQLLTRSVYSAGRATSSVVTADFNRDGIVDLAVGSFEGSSAVQVFLGNGDGTFRRPVAYGPGTGANSLAAADLNHDGIPDLVVANDVGESVTVLLGKGDGTFQAPLRYATPSVPAAVVLGDFNGDGNLDIVTTNQSDANTSCACVSVLLGNGDGTFQEPALITYPPYSLPQGLVAGHFTGGKNLDLAVTLGFISSDTVQVLLGNGDGTFTLGASYALGLVSQSIVAADLRKNGKTDLVVAELEGGGIGVLLGNSDGTFEPPVLYRILDPEAVDVGDMNGDGIPDLVAVRANARNGLVYGFLGNGDGTFRSPQIFDPVGQFPRALALADFNGDHQLDVTVADQTKSREYTLLNTGQVSFSPIRQVRFGKQKVGTTSPSQTVTMTNNGRSALTIASMKTNGQFRETSTCSTSLAAKATCTISVTFSPTSTGLKSGTVQINDSASTKPQVIALSGSGD